MIDSKQPPDVTEHSVKLTEDPALTEHPSQTSKRRTTTTIIFQVFCIVWLVPIIALLYLNFSNYIIGASAWCPGGDCALQVCVGVQPIPETLLQPNMST
jgi:hypothetical protein